MNSVNLNRSKLVDTSRVGDNVSDATLKTIMDFKSERANTNYRQKRNAQLIN